MPARAEAQVCPVCGADAGPRGACPERFCYLHQVQWNGSPERVGALLDNDEPDRAAAVIAALPVFIERARRAALEGQAKAGRKAADDEAERLESEIQGDIIKALQELKRKRQVFFWRANSGGAWIGEQFVRSNKSGTPDLITCVRVERQRAGGGKVAFGVLLGLEVKRPGEKQNTAQLKFEVELRDQGAGFYSVVCSAADALAAVDAAANLRRWP